VLNIISNFILNVSINILVLEQCQRILNLMYLEDYCGSDFCCLQMLLSKGLVMKARNKIL